MSFGQTKSDTRTVDATTAGLVRRVVTGEWPVEEKLPTERELVEALGVSRATVRSAIDRLKSWGMLVARQGSGTIVQPRIQWRVGGVPAVLEVLVDAEEWGILGVMIVDALGLRRALVLEMLERAAPLARGKSLTTASRATYQAWEARGDATEFLQRDHLVLAHALSEAGLQITLSLINEIRRTYEVGVLLLAGPFEVPANYVETHIAMLDALRDGDGERARARFEEYLDALDSTLAGALPQPLQAAMLHAFGDNS